MIDTHAHLDPKEAPAVLARARAAGVERVIIVATSIAGAHEALALAAGAELGLALRAIEPVTPFPGARDRHLHIYTKVAETPERFPRRPGIARKRPLG